ncbi:MAG: ATP-dependent DNA ligase [archaeon]
MLYLELAKIYEKLESTSKRLEKTAILSTFFSKLQEKEGYIVLLAAGSVFPAYEEREMGVSSQLAIKAISRATGVSTEEIIKEWKSYGDLGQVAEHLLEKRRQSTLFEKKLTTEKVYANLKKVAEFSGAGAVDKKVLAIAELISVSSPLEARYVVKTAIEELRIGVGEGALRDAILWSCFGKKLGIEYSKEKNELILNNREEYNKYSSAVQGAYDLTTDFSSVFESAKKGLKYLEEVQLKPGRPIKVMLALKAISFEKGFETVGKPAAIEYKYDGFRLMINKSENGKIKLFTRRLDDVTAQFPEVVDYVEKYVQGKSFIIDSEAVGYDAKNQKYRPFQEISQRIKRKYDIEKIRNELPVEVNVFDIIYFEGKNLLKNPFSERRKLLEKIVQNKKWHLKLSEQIITLDEDEAKKFYNSALNEGEEGIMMKNLNAPYKPGARVGYMLKLKPSEKEFDLVITGAEYGEGKRSGWMSSFILACRHGDRILEIGKVGTGIKEKIEQGVSFDELTRMLKPLVIEDKGRTVKLKPEVIVTVTYQEIQKSPKYSSGFALRFPRFTMLRPDRNIKDIASLEEIKKDYAKQNHS